MAKKRYCSRRWPSLRVGDSIVFENGSYTTENEAEQALIEGLTYFGPLVWHEPEAPADEVPFEASDSGGASDKRGKWRAR